jgi:hypothetical protein
MVTSNATLENSVLAPATGLGGIDSRSNGALPAIAARDGYRAVFCGMVYYDQPNGSRMEMLIRFEETGENENHDLAI